VSRYVEFALPDGSTVVIESDEPEVGVAKAAIGAGEVTKQAANPATLHQRENEQRSFVSLVLLARGGLRRTTWITLTGWLPWGGHVTGHLSIRYYRLHNLSSKRSLGAHFSLGTSFAWGAPA
jgi:hypothetical protein